MDRKAELERKKAKLQALRDEKDRRRKEKEQKDLEDAKAGLIAPEKDARKWVDLIRNVNIINTDQCLGILMKYCLLWVWHLSPKFYHLSHQLIQRRQINLLIILLKQASNQ